jgi:Secretion system C-terminal sorting domain
VYQLNNFNSEGLLYDFSLSIGSNHPLINSYSLITKDSISTYNGFSKRFIFSNSIDSIIWLEGIGNIASPFNINVSFSSGQSFLTGVICAYQNNTLVYLRNNLVPNVTCSSFVGIQDLQNKRIGASISPNPTTGKITITLPPPVEQLVNIEILDCYGRSVLKFNGTKNTTEIDISALSNGLYTLKIKALNQVFQSKLVLKD